MRQKRRRPAISCRFSCADLFRLHTFMGDCGFEPQKAMPADLQSVPFGHSGNLPYHKSWWTDLNPRPIDYKSIALPAELHQRRTNCARCARQRCQLYKEEKKLSSTFLPAQFRLLRDHVARLFGLFRRSFGFDPAVSAVSALPRGFSCGFD